MPAEGDGASDMGTDAGLGLEEHDVESGQSEPRLFPVKTPIRLKLYEAPVAGDWEMARPIYDKHPEKINDPITKRGETALHISALAEQSHFVKQLIARMFEDDLALKDVAGNTAFSVVAITKKVELADAMLKKNENLAMIQRKDQMLPLSIAVRLGHREMVLHLYEATKDKLGDEDRRNLLVPLIEADIYDIALNMLARDESLATEQDDNGKTALHALARKPSSGSEDIQKKLFLLLVNFVWDRVKVLEDSAISRLIGSDWAPIFIAAKEGNHEFLRILILSYPDIVYKLDKEKRTIFHIAILHRHENVFKLIHEIGMIKNLIIMYEDNQGNNMLHLAAMTAPPNRLNFERGAALQLQRELLWFEGVKLVKPSLSNAMNRVGQTPDDLFFQAHLALMEEGEKWMREKAGSCTLVATFIATVVFAAAFTIPGGNGQGTGIPIFLNEATFRLFAVSDAISLIFSVSSVLTFLSILTSSYRLDDFLWSLPSTLVVGLTTLFISIVAMMIAFIAAFFIAFKEHGLLGYTVPVAVISSIPIVLFIRLHRNLFLDVIKCTYLHRSFLPPNRRPVLHERAIPEQVRSLQKRLPKEAVRGPESESQPSLLKRLAKACKLNV